MPQSHRYNLIVIKRVCSISFMRFQFFGEADTMKLFKDDHDDLKDSEGTIQFFSRVHKLIRTMNSRTLSTT